MYMFTVWFCVDACCTLYMRQALRSVWMIVIDVFISFCFCLSCSAGDGFPFPVYFQLALKKGLIGPKRRDLFASDLIFDQHIQ